ncbi:MAG TPA: ribonuclease P protein component [Sphingobacteriaceae bacterium]|nr:ribonuclease P protein component [Sphingobacteriaceae bacterium]
MYTFKKEERLCSKKLLEKLFNSGSSFLVYPFRITWLISELPADVPAQVVINVSKRKFKKAVTRNLLKRRIREIYRLNKTDLFYSYLGKTSMALGINYVGNEIHDYHLMEKKIMLAFQKLEKLHKEQHA